MHLSVYLGGVPEAAGGAHQSATEEGGGRQTAGQAGEHILAIPQGRRGGKFSLKFNYKLCDVVLVKVLRQTEGNLFFGGGG